MRRGLISWSREEVPASALDARLARLQQEMRAERLDAVLAHTSFARPAAVAWLTHFVPYWNEALLAVFPSGASIMLAAFSKRVQSWIREVSHVGEIQSAPNLGRAAAALLEQRFPGKSAARLGVVDLDEFPWSVAEPIVKAGFGGALVDATPLYSRVRQPADDWEIRLARRASGIAAKSFAAIPARARDAAEVLSAAESAARLAGAEEFIARLAPDLGAGATLRRIEGDTPLGERYALELCVAYKAAWVRVARTLTKNGQPESWRHAAAWFARAASRLNEDNVEAGPVAAAGTPPGRLVSWTVESSIGNQPLSVTASSERASLARTLPRGALAALSLQLELGDGPWHGAAPLIVGSGRI